MVGYQNYQVQHVPIADAVNRLRLVQPSSQIVKTARDVEISLGDQGRIGLSVRWDRDDVYDLLER
jgi:hypothetical protein